MYSQQREAPKLSESQVFLLGKEREQKTFASLEAVSITEI